MAPPRKYSPELRERAVRMVSELREQTGVKTSTIARVADQLGVHREAVPVGLAGRGGDRGGTAEHNESRLRTQPVVVVAGGGQQVAGDGGADAGGGDQGGVGGGHQRNEQYGRVGG